MWRKEVVVLRRGGVEIVAKESEGRGGSDGCWQVRAEDGRGGEP